VSEEVIRVENLTKKFGNFVAVKGITFSVKKGEVLGFLGPNGAGKTTTLRMLCGLMVPSSGRAVLGGFDLATQAEKIKEIIGYMSQKFSLYEDLTVLENIDFYAGIYQIPEKVWKKKREMIIARAELFGKEEELVANLSLGFKQHLALGCALLHDPQIVFLDEPTAGVDPLVRRKFWEWIRDLARNGVTFIVTTHYLDEAEVCDRVMFIHHGEIVAEGKPQDLKKKWELPSLEEVFAWIIEEK